MEYYLLFRSIDKKGKTCYHLVRNDKPELNGGRHLEFAKTIRGLAEKYSVTPEGDYNLTYPLGNLHTLEREIILENKMRLMPASEKELEKFKKKNSEVISLADEEDDAAFNSEFGFNQGFFSFTKKSFF